MARRYVRRLRKLLGRRPDWRETYAVGRGTYGHPRVYAYGSNATLRVGDFCSFAANVQILLGGEHRTDWITTYPFNVMWEAGRSIQGHPWSRGDVIIGNDVWVGLGATILSGVTIGDGAVIGAGAVVAKDVPPYAIAIGNPAQVVRFRFDEATRSRLLRIQWWRWPDNVIEDALHLLLAQDVSALERFASSRGLLSDTHCHADSE